MRGLFALTLVIAAVLVLLGLSLRYFSLNTLNRAFLDYRRAMYQSYLSHDVEYSLYRLMSAVRDYCASTVRSSVPPSCDKVAGASYASFVSAWAANGVKVSGGGFSVLVLPDGVDVRLTADLVWRKGDYSGKIPAGYGVG